MNPPAPPTPRRATLVRPARVGPRLFWVALALATLAGCPDPGDGPRKGTPEPPDASKQVATPRGGIKVPLPPGWSARATAEETLVAGPPGKIVLRIEPWNGGGGSLPAPDALVSKLTASVHDLAVRVIDTEGKDDRALAVVQLTPLADAGGAAGWLALLGAKRLGSDLFLCSTAPGASEDQVKAAAAACGGMSRTQ